LSSEALKQILSKFRIVAIVGLSRDPSKDSYQVAEYLKKHGFKIVPVNPFVEEVLGEKSYRSLLEMPADVQKSLEIVDIFRPSADVPIIVDQAVQLRRQHGVPHVIWMQLGIANKEAAEKAQEAGLTVVMNRCMKIEHHSLLEG
jgi:hypothetical protein